MQTFEDHYLHTDVELRRSVIWEHIARESLHPYHWILKSKRRNRYHKVERGLKGFIAPEYIQNEAKTQTYRDYQRVEREWADFVFNNYTSELTPNARRTALPNMSLDLALNYGIMSPQAWERYFFNERDRTQGTEKEIGIARDPRKFPLDLTTPEGRKEFENEINEVNDKHPGLVAVEGQKFDFKKYYQEIGVQV